MDAVTSLVQYLGDITSLDYTNAQVVENTLNALNAYKSKEADWDKYAFFDSHRYTRNLVDAVNGKFSVMILCWGPNMRSSIHDHTNAHCFVKVLRGKLKEIQYGWPKEGELEEMKSCQEMFFPRDGVTYINDVIGLHRMENPSHTDIAVTLHVYIPPFDICQTFDQHTGQSKRARMSCYSRYGVKLRAQNSGSTESLN